MIYVNYFMYMILKQINLNKISIILRLEQALQAKKEASRNNHILVFGTGGAGKVKEHHY